MHKKSIESENNKVGQSFVVKGASIDSFIQDKNIKKVDIIKMDIQGHEPMALKGASTTINKLRPIVLMECYYDDLYKEDSPLTQLFKDSDYCAFMPGSKEAFEIELEQFQKRMDKNRSYQDIAFVPAEKVHLLYKKP